MAETTFRGPTYSAGSMLDGRDEVMDGPVLHYQGEGFPDLRFFPTRKDGMYPGRVPAWQNSPLVVMADNIPQAIGTASLAALALQTASVPMALVTTQANGSTAGNPTLSPGVPLVPFGSNTPVSVIALDFGYTTGTTTTGAASQTITVPDSTLFYVGQWLYVGGAGNSGKTLPLLTQVTSLATATTITVSLGALAAVTNAPIGNANLPGIIGPPGISPNSVFPYFAQGLGTFLDPPEAITRAVSITGVAGGVGTATNGFTIVGYDVYGVRMTATLSGPVGATTVNAPKAMKYVQSITPVVGFTDTTHNYSAGISDIYGFHLRDDKWEYLNIYWAGSLVTASTGWTKAVLTNPSTAATGDVRGTYATQSASNGTTNRLVMAINVPLYNNLFGTPVTPAPLYGVTQV